MKQQRILLPPLPVLVAGLGFIFCEVTAQHKPADAKPASDNLHFLQSPEARPANREASDYGLGDGHISKLLPYPPGGPGVRTPFVLWRYAGRGDSSWGSPNLPKPWDD